MQPLLRFCLRGMGSCAGYEEVSSKEIRSGNTNQTNTRQSRFFFPSKIKRRVVCSKIQNWLFRRWLLENQRKFNYDVQIKNMTDDVACLGIAGPRSREVLSKLTSSDLRDEAFPYLTFKTIELCGLSVQACRFSFTGKKIHISDVVIQINAEDI